MLKLVVVVYSLKGVEIDGRGGGNDHVEAIGAEITMPGILHNLWENDLFEPNDPIDHDTLPHQHYQLSIG